VTASTITTADPVQRGSWLRLDGEDVLLVTGCTGVGPYLLTVRPVTRWDRCQAWLRHQVRRPREWWLETRCLPDHGWCWRKATADSLCDRHWLLAVEDGEDL
jgi:hypothetical protein